MPGSSEVGGCMFVQKMSLLLKVLTKTPGKLQGSGKLKFEVRSEGNIRWNY